MRNNDTLSFVGILIVISILNIIFSTYFIPLFLAGVVFKIFLVSLKKEHYYILTLSIFVFLLIEVVQGLKPFLLTVDALLLYYFIIPKMKHTFSSQVISEFIFILLFYVIIFSSTLFYLGLNVNMLFVFIYNFFIDIFIVGFLL